MTSFLSASHPNIEGWRQVGELGLALLLSALIGVERQIRQKSAGLRTHTLVAVGAALFVLISKYGLSDVLVPGQIVLDPSRVAAQIVTGIGFIGGGLIFVRRDAVRMVEVSLQIHGRGSVNHLATELSELPGVEAVVADDIHSASE
jgi:hypothetical protein